MSRFSDTARRDTLREVFMITSQSSGIVALDYEATGPSAGGWTLRRCSVFTSRPIPRLWRPFSWTPVLYA